MTNGRVLLGLVLAAGALSGQPAPGSGALTLKQAVDAALGGYPSIQVSQEQIDAAAAGIRLARTAYLPRVDGLAQVNRATRNNVFGLLLPQSVIPSISGPVLGSNNFGSVWGSAVGALVAWEPFDFGLRRANVEVAEAARAEAEAARHRSEFEVALATADAYLTLVAARETVRGAEAGVERAGVTARSTAALVGAELRPGADDSRAEAELAAARTQLIRAQQAEEVARATLSQFTGLAPAGITVASAGLLRLPPAKAPEPPDMSATPFVLDQAATLEQARAQLRALARSYFPRFAVQGAAYARGTGAEVSGLRLGGLNGLAPSVQNYALGFTVTFPFSDLASIRAREAAQSAAIHAQMARQAQLAAELRAQWNAAVANVEGSRRVAENTPIQVSAATAAARQAAARYQAGLGTIDAVAEAQRLLTQAEIDDSLAHLAVWRGLLGIAAVAGDIQPFATEASQ